MSGSLFESSLSMSFCGCGRSRKPAEATYSPLETNPTPTKVEGCFAVFKGLDFLPRRFREFSEGVYVYPFFGTVYEGSLRYGIPDGKGILKWDNGDVYKGDFIDGKITGKGIFKWTNGDVYEGDFIDGERTGKGIYKWTNGKVYEGDFIDGKITGKGIFKWTNGEVYQGDFIDGKRTGKGIYKWANGGVYEGDFIDGERTGKGIFKWTNGDVYEGDFIDGERTGKGIYKWANGETYKGKFFKNMALSDKSNLGDLAFAKLLFGYQANGFACQYGLGVISDYLSDAIYSNWASPLIQAKLLLRESSESASEIIYKALQKGESRLISYGYKSHSMGLNFVPTEDGAFVDCEIFNSGSGLSRYHPKVIINGKRKYETMLRVRVPIAELSPEKIKQLVNCNKFSTVEESYDAILGIPGATIIPGTGILQAAQKSGNCSLEWIFAYLKNKMPLKKYHAMRLRVFIDCLKKAKENEKESDPLTEVIPQMVIESKLERVCTKAFLAGVFR